MRILASNTVSALAFALLVTSGPAAGQDTEAPKVAVAAAYTQELIDEVTFIARGAAIDKVDLRARVSGFVDEIYIEDGDRVTAGTPLFKIEPEVYEANLAARQADLAQAQANLELARIELARKTELFERDVGTEADRDVAFANNQVAKAQVEIAKAAIQQAQLDLDYTVVTAPFDGLLSKSAVSEGELVGPTSSPLINLVRTAPVYVEFSLTEKQLVELIEYDEQQTSVLDKTTKIPDVQVILPTGELLDEKGLIGSADNSIDPTTGTITVRVTFENKRGLIIDGSFLNVRISSAEPSKVLMVPQAAVQRDQRGDFVLVVGQQRTVEQRYVQLGRVVEAAVVVTDGLREGEGVIVEGLQRVRPGVEVDAILAGTGSADTGEN